NPEFADQHRVLIEQFFYSDPTRWRGYSGAINVREDTMSFELGVGQLIVLPLILIFFGNFNRLRRLLDIRLVTLGTVTFAGWLAGLAFMMYPIIFLRFLPQAFSYIQFPWRFLGIEAFFAATTIAVFASCLSLSSTTKALFVAATLLILALVPGFE